MYTQIYIVIQMRYGFMRAIIISRSVVKSFYNDKWHDCTNIILMCFRSFHIGFLLTKKKKNQLSERSSPINERLCANLYMCIENNKRCTGQAKFVVFSVDFYAFHCYYFVFYFCRTLWNNWSTTLRKLYWTQRQLEFVVFFFFYCVYIDFFFWNARIKHFVRTRVLTIAFCNNSKEKKLRQYNFNSDNTN